MLHTHNIRYLSCNQKKIVNYYYGRLGCHSCIFGFQTGNKLCYLDGLLLVSELVSSAIGGGFRFLGMAPNEKIRYYAKFQN